MLFLFLCVSYVALPFRSVLCSFYMSRDKFRAVQCAYSFCTLSGPDSYGNEVYKNKKPEKSLLIVLVAYLFSGYRARKLKPEANLIAFCQYRRKKLGNGC